MKGERCGAREGGRAYYEPSPSPEGHRCCWYVKSIHASIRSTYYTRNRLSSVFGSGCATMRGVLDYRRVIRVRCFSYRTLLFLTQSSFTENSVKFGLMTHEKCHRRRNKIHSEKFEYGAHIATYTKHHCLDKQVLYGFGKYRRTLNEQSKIYFSTMNTLESESQHWLHWLLYFYPLPPKSRPGPFSLIFRILSFSLEIQNFEFTILPLKNV